MSMCHPSFLVYNIQVPFEFLFAYLVILEEITLISFYLQKYLTKPYSTCSLYILVILWIVELNSATATSRTNLYTIIAQHLWGFGSERLSVLRREGTAEGAPAWLTKGEARKRKRLDGLEVRLVPSAGLPSKSVDFKEKFAGTEFQTQS